MSFNVNVVESVAHELSDLTQATSFTNCRLVSYSIYTVFEQAPGADGKECVVVTTSQDLSGSAEQLLDSSAFAGLTVSLSILKQLQHHVGWMSKRVVLLVVDSDEEGEDHGGLHVGVKAFVDDYHLNTLDLVER